MAQGLSVIHLSVIVCCTFFITLSHGKGIFFGVVRDKVTGNGIPHARLHLMPGDSILSTDSLGAFIIRGLPAGDYDIEISAKGYYSKFLGGRSLNIGRPEELTVILVREPGEDVLELATKTVKSKSTARPATRGHEAAGAFHLNSQDIYLAPAVKGDISQIIKTLPGVAANNDQKNDMVVRGGGINENAYLLDGIPTLKISHFAGNGGENGRIGNINLYFVDDIVFHNGAFSARYPDKMSSIMELKFREGNTVKL